MSDELNAEVDRLKSENRKLTGDLASLTDELKEVRHEARDRRHEAKTLATQLAELATERDKFKADAETDPENLRKTIADLTGKIRGTTHRSAFDKVAASLKVTDATRQADLYALSGYQPDGDDVDEKKLAETIQGALKGRPWFLDAPTTAPGGATGAKAEQLGEKPGPGSDRGQSLAQQSSAARTRIPGRL